MSRIAWFRAVPPDAADPLDETAPIIEMLARTHRLDVITAARAHEFVWRHFRDPYTVVVYEPGSTPAHRFMRAYAAHYPGVTAPRGLGVERPRPVSRGPASAAAMRVGALGRAVDGAVARAVALGATVEMIAGDPVDVLARADVVVALEWPPAPGPPTAALLGMAAAKAVIVFEIEATAGWPALDPQTWLPRGAWLPADRWPSGGRSPIVVSIDPRDEEHSLMLALVRLSAEPALRTSLAAAAHAWWRAHATLEHAVAAWEALIARAGARPLPRGAGADYSDRLRDQLAPFGVSVDFLQA
jgi:hypothetical protein